MSEKAYFLEQLIALNTTPDFALRKPSFEYYREWHHTTIRALLDIVDINENPGQLVKIIFPPLSLKKVKASLVLLKKLNLIKKDENGNWRPSDQGLHSGAYMKDEFVKKYQVECLDIAKLALLNHTDLAQNISTECLSLSVAAVKKIESKLQKFKSDIREITRSDTNKADRVYQMNIQLFPQSK